jgi:hypothetical protein
MKTLLVFALQATAATTAPALAMDASGFARQLNACTAATFEMPHPLMPDFTIRHEIGAEHHEQACEYSQTMPGGMRMECLFTAAGRRAYAAEFEALAAGRLQGGTSQSPAWSEDCEIVTADGRRLPVSGTTATPD